MRIIVSIFASLLISTTAFAQSSTMSSPSKGQSGFSVGLDFFNFNEFNGESETTGNGYRSTYDTKRDGMGLGFAGVDIGYNKTPESGLGFAAKIMYINRSQAGGNTSFLTPQLNLTAGFSRTFSAYIGANVTDMTTPYMYGTKRPEVGGQAGIGIRFNQVTWNLGYLVMRQKIEDEMWGYKSASMLSFGGFHSSLAYTF